MVVNFTKLGAAVKTHRSTIGLGLVGGLVTGICVFFLVFLLVAHNKLTVHTEPADTRSDSVQKGITIELLMNYLEHPLEVAEAPELNQLSSKELNELISATQQVGDRDALFTLRKLLFEELASKEPNSALALIWDFPPKDWNTFVNIVFANWPSKNLAGALDAIEYLSPAIAKDARHSLLTSNRNSLESIKEYFVSKKMSDAWKLSIQECESLDLLTQPSAAWKYAIDDEISNNLQQGVFGEILNTWIYQEGFHVLAEVLEYQHNIDPYYLNNLVTDVVESHPQAAFEAIVLFPLEKRNRLLEPVLKAWSKHDPEAAYSALKSVENFDGGDAMLSILNNWATTYPESLIQNIEMLSRAQRLSAATRAISQLTSQDPGVAQKLLAAWTDIPGVIVDNLEDSFVRRWAMIDPVKTLDWVQKNVVAGSQQHANLLSMVLQQLSQDDSEKALEIALSQPSSSFFVRNGLVSDLVFPIARNGEIDLVLDILDQIPESARISVYSQLARQLIYAARWDDAIKLTEKLPDDIRTWYIQRLTYHSIESNVYSLLERLPTISPETTRSIIAQELLETHEYEGDLLSNTEVEFVSSLIDDSQED